MVQLLAAGLFGLAAFSSIANARPGLLGGLQSLQKVRKTPCSEEHKELTLT